jgi:hypothetical protein
MNDDVVGRVYRLPAADRGVVAFGGRANRLELRFPISIEEGHGRCRRDAKLTKFQGEDQTMQFGRSVPESGTAANARLGS